MQQDQHKHQLPISCIRLVLKSLQQLLHSKRTGTAMASARQPFQSYMHLVAQNHHPSPPSAASYFSRRASSSSSTSTSASRRRPAPPRRHRKTTHSSSAAAGAGSRKALAARAELARHIKQVKAERDGAHRGENRGDLLDDLVDEEVDPLAPEPPDVLYKRRERLWQQLLWMSRRGKGKETMHATVRKENLLRQWFAYLDADASQRISVDELEDPLISVGLAHSRRSVENLIRSVDKSSGGEGEITFDEFKELLHKNRETLYDDEGESGSKDPLQRLVAKPARRVRRASAAYGDSGSSGGGVGSGVGGGGKGGAFGVLPSSGSRGRSASGHWGEVAQIVKQRREKKYGGGTSGNNQKKMGGGRGSGGNGGGNGGGGGGVGRFVGGGGSGGVGGGTGGKQLKAPNKSSPPKSPTSGDSDTSNQQDVSLGDSGNKTAIVRFFEAVESGRFGDNTNLPLSLLIGTYRRKLLLQANVSVNAAAKREGQRVLDAIISTHPPGTWNIAEAERAAVDAARTMPTSPSSPRGTSFFVGPGGTSATAARGAPRGAGRGGGGGGGLMRVGAFVA